MCIFFLFRSTGRKHFVGNDFFLVAFHKELYNLLLTLLTSDNTNFSFIELVFHTFLLDKRYTLVLLQPWNSTSIYVGKLKLDPIITIDKEGHGYSHHFYYIARVYCTDLNCFQTEVYLEPWQQTSGMERFGKIAVFNSQLFPQEAPS